MTSDEALMDRVVAGDAAAFDELLRRHGKPLFQYLTRQVGSAVEAEDLVQTTFVKILQAAPSFDPRLKFTTWAYRIASNLCVDYFRRQQHRRADSLDEPLPGQEETTLGDTLADQVASPEQCVTARALHAAIRNALHTLSEEQRAVVLLCHFEGLSYPEIAESLEIPVGTVKSRMHNAMQRLRTELQDWM